MLILIFVNYTRTHIFNIKQLIIRINANQLTIKNQYQNNIIGMTIYISQHTYSSQNTITNNFSKYRNLPINRIIGPSPSIFQSHRLIGINSTNNLTIQLIIKLY